MYSSWQEFVQQQGAIFTPNGSYFQTPQADARIAQEQTALVDLSHLSSILISGPQAQSFLQGQFTCDVAAINAHHSSLAAHCNLQGRMVALGRLLALPDNSYYWLLPSQIQASAERGLQKYARFSKVTISTHSSYSQFAIAGAEATAALQSLKLPISTGTENVIHVEQTVIVSEPGPQPKFIIIAPMPIVIDYWRNLAQSLPMIGSQAWQLLSIFAQQAWLSAETIGQFLPQEFNLGHFAGLSFNKGCYLGQEVIARVHYLGKLKKQLSPISITSTQPPIPNSKLIVNEQVAGQLICSAPLDHQHYQGLALLAENSGDEFQIETQGSAKRL